jgi:hypothetical protein
MRTSKRLARFVSARPVRLAAVATLILLPVHILINGVGVAIAAKHTADLGVSFVTAEWIARAVLFVVGQPLLLWTVAWMVAYLVFVVWEMRGPQSRAS